MNILADAVVHNGVNIWDPHLLPSLNGWLVGYRKKIETLVEAVMPICPFLTGHELLAFEMTIIITNFITTITSSVGIYAIVVDCVFHSLPSRLATL